MQNCNIFCIYVIYGAVRVRNLDCRRLCFEQSSNQTISPYNRCADNAARETFIFLIRKLEMGSEFYITCNLLENKTTQIIHSQ